MTEEVIVVEDYVSNNAYCRLVAREEKDGWWTLVEQGRTSNGWKDGETLGYAPKSFDPEKFEEPQTTKS